jgi:hypothetical protein
MTQTRTRPGGAESGDTCLLGSERAPGTTPLPAPNIKPDRAPAFGLRPRRRHRRRHDHGALRFGSTFSMAARHTAAPGRSGSPMMNSTS